MVVGLTGKSYKIMKKIERKIKIKFEKLVKNEDVMYDNYFKIVYSSKVVLNNQNINFRYTEEEGSTHFRRCFICCSPSWTYLEPFVKGYPRITSVIPGYSSEY